MGRLDGKTALITGAAGGQGEAEARAFAREGAQVVVADILHEQGQAVATDIGDNALYVPLDVRSEVAWQAGIETAIKQFGKLDALINNAGIVHHAAVTHTTLDDYRRVIDVNQIGVFLGMRAVAPHMKRGGSIINISSIDGLTGMPGVVAYAASKYAVRGMTKVAALEFAALGIRVNSIHPGAVESPMTADPEIEAVMNAAMDFIPMGRVANTIEIAPMAVYLASDDSSYSTGAEFVVDGGMTCGLTFVLGASA